MKEPYKEIFMLRVFGELSFKEIGELFQSYAVGKSRESIIALMDICPEFANLLKADGSIEEVEVILAFEFKDTKKEYVIYTKNEKDENDNITVYVSNVDRTGEEPRLLGVDTEEEWNRIKDVLRELSKSE